MKGLVSIIDNPPQSGIATMCCKPKNDQFDRSTCDVMRVMILASGDLWAGAEVMVFQLACGLAGIPGVDFFVILLNKKRLAEELEKLGVRVRIIEESKHSFPAIVYAVRTLIAEFSPDIIHSHRYKENLLAWISSCGRKNIKLVATQHGMPETAKEGIRLAGRLRTSSFFRLLSCCFDYTVLVSREMQQNLLGSYGFSVRKVAVIHNGISIPEDIGNQIRQRIVIGSAGRLFPIKDFSLLVDIAHLVVAQSDVVDFVLAGEGPQHAKLEEKIKSYGLQGRFRLLGHQDNMVSFYRSLDVYINTSVHEGIPMSVLEAMSYGLPVIAPKVGGLPEIVEEQKSGFLVEGRNPSVFAQQILELLDPKLRASMSTAARERVVLSFSRERMTQNYYQLYEELVGGS